MFKTLPKGLKIIFWIVLGNGLLMWFFLIASGLLSGFPLSGITGLFWLLNYMGVFAFVPISFIFGIITLIIVKGRRKELWLFSFIPFILSFVFFVSWFYQPPVHWFLKDWQFERHFNQYNQMVKQIQASNQDLRIFITVPKSVPARRVDGGKGVDGIVVVMFWVYGNFPVSRGGYVYISNDSWDPKLGFTRDYHPRKIKPCWYAFTE